MASLDLKDITNLPPNLPFSLIPQQGAGLPTALPYHHNPPLQNAGKHLAFPQQRRLHALSGNDSGCELMDDSLTDMQWLQRMDAGSDFPGLMHGQCRKKMAGKTNRSSGKDGCRKKLDYSSKKGNNKPPLSYASLIALAICSTPQRMMTLSSIYRWIEYTFPFYRTPEAKAWKNSIRHNLSIRKNMFMKVYQYPPRRGNGSYWTLLSDGEEELKKAVPLFATLQPPVIDTNCAYHKEPSTHTVKSKGKFVPVLPRSDFATSGMPYFSVGGPTSYTSGSRMTGNPSLAADEVIIGESSDEDPPIRTGFNYRGKGRLGKRPRHLSDHDYAKPWEQGGGQGAGQGDEQEEVSSGVKQETEVVELATGRSSGEGKSSEQSFVDRSTPKRKRKLVPSEKPKPCRVVPCSRGGGAGEGSSPPFAATPTKDQDTSLHLLDSSFLTPLKNFGVTETDIGPISFSPLYANLVTPKRESTTIMTSSDTSSSVHPFFPSPLTPLKSSLDSGIFSPLRSDLLGGVKFSTPTRMNSLSPLVDLSTLSSLQPELYPLKVLDTSEGAGGTPLRPGSLQAFGLPGLTPPPSKE